MVIKETTNREKFELTPELFKELQDYLHNHNIVSDELQYDGNVIECDINDGDWKHDHLATNWAIIDFFKDKKVDVCHNQWTTKEDGSDTYSAHHIWELCKFKTAATSESIKESLDDKGSVTTLDDVIAGMIGNMSDDDIDSNLKLFSRIGKVLGVPDYSKVIVFIDTNDEYNLSYYINLFDSVTDVYKKRDDIKLFIKGSAKCIQETYRNGNVFIYAKSENDIQTFLDAVDEYNATDVSESKSITEDYDPKDTEFNDKYFPRVDLSKYIYYKHGDNEYAYDMTNALLIDLFKDDDEVAHFGKKDAPYRELDAIGLSRETWNDKAERDEMLSQYEFNKNEEASYLAQDFINNELPYYQKNLD